MAAAEFPPELAQLIESAVAEYGETLKRVARASVSFGADAAKKAMMETLQEVFTAAKEVQAAEAGLEVAKNAARANGVIPPGEYGAVAQSIRVALRALYRQGPGGVTATTMLRYINGTLGNKDIQEQQIRNTLKGMIKSGHVEVASRGMYRPGRKLLKLFEEAA